MPTFDDETPSKMTEFERGRQLGQKEGVELAGDIRKMSSSGQITRNRPLMHAEEVRRFAGAVTPVLPGAGDLERMLLDCYASADALEAFVESLHYRLIGPSTGVMGMGKNQQSPPAGIREQVAVLRERLGRLAERAQEVNSQF